MELKRILKLFSFTAFLALVCCFSAFATRETAKFDGGSKTVEYEIINSQLQGETVKKLIIYSCTGKYNLDKFFIKKLKKSNINLRSIAYDNLEYNLIRSHGKFGLSLSIGLIDLKGEYKHINYTALKILLHPLGGKDFGSGQPCIDEVIIEDAKIEPPHGYSYTEGVLNLNDWSSFWRCDEIVSFFGLKKETVWPCCCDGVIRFHDLAAPVGKFKDVFEPLVQSQRDAILQKLKARIKRDDKAREQKAKEWREKQELQENAKEERRKQEAAKMARLPQSEQLKIKKENLQQQLLNARRRLISREAELSKWEHQERIIGKRRDETYNARINATNTRKLIATLEYKIEKLA